MDRTDENEAVDIKPGDVVRLRSSGPDMTVERVGENGAVCIWFPGDVPSAAMVAAPGRYEFPLVCLERLED